MASLDLRPRRGSRAGGRLPVQPLDVSSPPPPAPAPAPSYDSGTGATSIPSSDPYSLDGRGAQPPRIISPEEEADRRNEIGAPATGPLFPGPGRRAPARPGVVDPSKLNDFRKAAENARHYENQTDTEVLADPRYAHFAQTGEYRPSSQPWPDAETAGGNFGHRVPGLFDDPSTAQLEGWLNQQIAELQKPNDQLNQLMGFLNQQFTAHSQSPGFSPEEMAVIRTQALEPVEAMRQASKQRALERAGARGFLPSSGLHELDLRDIDIAADRNRTVLDRDLAISQIGERNADIQRALQFAGMGFQVPNAYRRENLNDILTRSRELYNLPRQAMADANAVVSGAPMPGDLFQQALQLMSARENQNRYEQQRTDRVLEQLGEWAAQYFGGDGG